MKSSWNFNIQNLSWIYLQSGRGNWNGKITPRRFLRLPWHEKGLIQSFKMSLHLICLGWHLSSLLWIRSGEWLAIKGKWSISQDILSGGSFGSSQWARFRSSLKNPARGFFPISIYPARLCSETQPGTPSLSYIIKSLLSAERNRFGTKKTELVLPLFGNDTARQLLNGCTQFSHQIGQFSNFRNEIYKTWGFQQFIAWSTKVAKNLSTRCLFHKKIANFE